MWPQRGPGPELERKLTLLQAAWSFFDQVAGRVSAEMQKGVRGGGRDRDEIIVNDAPHTIIGVMKPRFAFPDNAEAWIPIGPVHETDPRSARTGRACDRCAGPW